MKRAKPVKANRVAAARKAAKTRAKMRLARAVAKAYRP